MDGAVVGAVGGEAGVDGAVVGVVAGGQEPLWEASRLERPSQHRMVMGTGMVTDTVIRMTATTAAITHITVLATRITGQGHTGAAIQVIGAVAGPMGEGMPGTGVVD